MYRDDRTQDRLEPEEREREISLGTSMILGIFFGLALLCAVFFGFGYSMGRHSSQPAVAKVSESPAAAESGEAKPSPGSPETSGPVQPQADDSSGANVPEGGNEATPAPAVVVRQPPVPASGRAARAASAAATVAAAANPAPVPIAAGGPGTFIVQVAAVSHKEDAGILVTELKKKGYSVTVRQVPQDKLLHIQLGPFASKKDAEAMKQRLLGDGYNAIVK